LLRLRLLILFFKLQELYKAIIMTILFTRVEGNLRHMLLKKIREIQDLATNNYKSNKYRYQ
jgi:hypothetical protein